MPTLKISDIPEEKLGHFAIPAPTLTTSDVGEAAKRIFEESAEAEGIVVLEYGRPAGIIMRNVFYQKMSALYGNSLYLNRSVSIMMDTAFLSADAEDTISKVGLQATGRNQDKLYDFIVVYRSGSYLGVISIHLFLAELSRRNEAQIVVLKEQQQKLMAAHEEEQRLRTHLEYQSAAVRNLLDHAEQGFLWFGGDLVIKNEVSYTCFSLFGKNVGGLCFTDLMAACFTEDRMRVFKEALESYFHNNSPVTDAVYLLLLPSDCTIGDRRVHLQYRRIESELQKAVMVVMNDITEKVALEQAMSTERYQQRLLIKAFSCQGQIKRMIEEFRGLFSGGYQLFFENDGQFRENLDSLFRAVHTYKGDFAQYGFNAAAEKLHVLESALLSLIDRQDDVNMSEVEEVFRHADAQEILAGDLNVIAGFLGEGYLEQSETIPVPKSKLTELEHLLSDASLPRGEILAAIRGLRAKSVKAYLRQYEDYVEYLSGRLGKSMPVFLVEGDEVEVDGDRFNEFFSSLVHIFRNCLDHGIESDEERVEAGKEQRGSLQCTLTALEDGRFSLRISDDGRGILTEKLKARALERGIYAEDRLDRMSDRELCGLIFSDHLSTKDEVSSLSGRGVGMSAVRGACVRLGGSIDVETRAGMGTAFIMTLPIAAA